MIHEWLSILLSLLLVLFVKTYTITQANFAQAQPANGQDPFAVVSNNLHFSVVVADSLLEDGAIPRASALADQMSFVTNF